MSFCLGSYPHSSGDGQQQTILIVRGTVLSLFSIDAQPPRLIDQKHAAAAIIMKILDYFWGNFRFS